MSRLWLSVADEDRLLNEVSQRTNRLHARVRSVTPDQAQLAGAYGDAYPWMDPSLISSLTQAGVSPDSPQAQQVATLAAEQASDDGSFSTPGDDLADPWYEKLSDTLLGWAKPAVRTGFTALMTPYEELQALITSLGEVSESDPKAEGGWTPAELIADLGELPEDIGQFWDNYTNKAARSGGMLALGDLLAGKHVDMGQGFLPGGEIWEERERAKQRLQLDGEFLTPGRLVARDVTEPGTTPYQVVSGTTDAAIAIFADPFAKAAKPIVRGAQAARSFQATGALNGIRRTVDTKTAVNHYLQTGQGRRMVRYLTENQDVETAWKAIGEADLGVADALAKTTSDTETVGILQDVLGSVVREKPTAGFVGQTIGAPVGAAAGAVQGLRTGAPVTRSLNNLNYGRLFGGGAAVRRSASNSRFFAEMPGQTLNPSNINRSAKELDRWMRNARFDEATRKSVLGEVAQLQDGDAVGLFNATRKVMRHTEDSLVSEWGLRRSRARGLTQMYEAISDDLVGYAFDDLGRHVDVDAPYRAFLGDEVVQTPKGQPMMISELVSDNIPLPPTARDIRRATPAVLGLDTPALQKLYGSKLWKVPIDGMDAVMSNAWKPFQLLRGAYTLRVIAEEQMRMAGAGYDSMLNNPIKAIAWSLSVDSTSRLGKVLRTGLDPKGTKSITGEIWDDITEHAAAMSRGNAGHLGLPGEILTGRYVKATPDDPEFYRGWTTELSHMANDPVMRRLAGGLSRGDMASTPRLAARGQRDLGSGEFFFHKTARPDEILEGGMRQGGFFGDLGRAQAFRDPDMPILIFRRADFPEDARGMDFIQDMTDSRILDEMDELARAESTAHAVVGEIPRPVGVARGDDVTWFDETTDVISDVKDWFWSGSGKKFREQIGQVEGRSAILTEKSVADEVIDQMVERLRRSTGGSSDLTELVATGQLDDLSLRGFGHEQKLARVLEDSYFDVRPAAVKKAEAVRARGADGSWRRVIDAGFDVLMSRPTNWLSRSPTFRQKYYQRVEELLGSAPRGLQEDMIRAAREANVGDDVLKRMASRVLGGEGDALASLDEVDFLAKSFALDETRKLLYDLNKRSQFFDMTRLIFPFGEAWKEIIGAWTGILRKNPAAVRRFQQGIQGARSSSVLPGAQPGLTPAPGTDPEELAELEDEGFGRGFFHTDPQTGEEVFTYPAGWAGQLLSKLPGPLGAAGEQLAGTDERPGVRLTGRATGLNIVSATVLPGFGPAIQIPAGQIIPHTPKWDDVREMLMPFGAAQGDDVIEQSIDALLPAWADKLRTAMQDPQHHRLFANTVADVQRSLLARGKHDISTRDGQQALYDEAVQAAKGLYVVRGLAQSTAPTGPSFQWNTTDVQGNIVPVKVLSDEYRRLATEEYGGDWDMAFTEWVRRFGTNNVLSLIGKSHRLVDRPVTEAGDEWLRAHQEEERDFNLTIGLFAPEPPAGEFDYEAYLRQFETGAREATTPAEQLDLANDLLGRVQFEQVKTVASFRPGPATNLWVAQMRDQIAEQYPGFDGWVAESQWAKRPSTEQMIDEMRRAVQNPRLASTDAGRGILKYLSAIEVAKGMTFALPGNVKHYQQAKAAEPIRFFLRGVAREIIGEHPDFARAWNNVFERELADDDIGTGVSI